MAVTSTSKLQIGYVSVGGNSVTHNFPYVDPELCTTANVNALITAEIDNGSIFAQVPASVKDAKIITTTTTDVTL